MWPQVAADQIKSQIGHGDPIGAANLNSQLLQAEDCRTTVMPESLDASDQSHPLEAIDRDHLDRLLARDSPGDADLVELSRLLIRYEGFPGAEGLQKDLQRLLSLWKISRDELNSRARQIWAGGFRPGAAADEAVGSGFDTSETEKS